MAIYRGRKVTLNKPQKGGSKKLCVCESCNKVKKFFAIQQKIRKNNKAARKSFGTSQMQHYPKTKARY